MMIKHQAPLVDVVNNECPIHGVTPPQENESNVTQNTTDAQTTISLKARLNDIAENTSDAHSIESVDEEL